MARLLIRAVCLGAVALAFSGAAARAQGRLTVRGTLVDSISGDPVDQATVYRLSGSQTQTDPQGRFSLSGVPRGGLLILIRRIGYRPRAIQFDAPAGTAVVEIGTLRLVPNALVLDRIAVEEQRLARNPRLAEFNRRRKLGAGTFITQDEILKRNPMWTTEMIEMIPWVRMENRQPVNRRAVSLRRPRPCEMPLIVDGILSPTTLDEIPPAWIAGMEVHRNGNALLDFGHFPCGAVVIWTESDL